MGGDESPVVVLEAEQHVANAAAVGGGDDDARRRPWRRTGDEGKPARPAQDRAAGLTSGTTSREDHAPTMTTGCHTLAAVIAGGVGDRAVHPGGTARVRPGQAAAKRDRRLATCSAAACDGGLVADVGAELLTSRPAVHARLPLGEALGDQLGGELAAARAQGRLRAGCAGRTSRWAWDPPKRCRLRRIGASVSTTSSCRSSANAKHRSRGREPDFGGHHRVGDRRPPAVLSPTWRSPT